MLNKTSIQSEGKNRIGQKKTNPTMIRTVVYITPRQYAKYQAKAITAQRHFAELVREQLGKLLMMKDLSRYLTDRSVMEMLGKIEDTVSVQIYIPESTKKKLMRLQVTHGYTQSGLFRVALARDQS